MIFQSCTRRLYRGCERGGFVPLRRIINPEQIGEGRWGIVGQRYEGSLEYTLTGIRLTTKDVTFSITPVSPQSYDSRFP